MVVCGAYSVVELVVAELIYWTVARVMKMERIPDGKRDRHDRQAPPLYIQNLPTKDVLYLQQSTPLKPCRRSVASMKVRSAAVAVASRSREDRRATMYRIL